MHAVRRPGVDILAMFNPGHTRLQGSRGMRKRTGVGGRSLMRQIAGLPPPLPCGIVMMRTVCIRCRTGRLQRNGTHAVPAHSSGWSIMGGARLWYPNGATARPWPAKMVTATATTAARQGEGLSLAM